MAVLHNKKKSLVESRVLLKNTLDENSFHEYSLRPNVPPQVSAAVKSRTVWGCNPVLCPENSQQLAPELPRLSNPALTAKAKELG